jgi:predicted nucleic acid-binding Zn ribbon protein
MPVYAYECKAGHRTERVKSIKISDKKLENDKCEVCGKKATLQHSRPAPPILIGRGFHCNEYNAPTK